MPLPTAKTTREIDAGRTKILIYGQPKIGKSTFASFFPKALFIATEPGHQHLEIFKQDCASWSAFLDICAELVQHKHDFKTIVIDTTDNLAVFCKDHICAKNKMDHPADKEYGKGWALVNDEFQRAILKVASLGYGMVFISHAAEKDTKIGNMSVARSQPTLTTGARRLLIGLCDTILYCGISFQYNAETKENEERRFGVCTPVSFADAGDRLGIFPPKFILPKTQEDFNNLLKKDQKNG